MKCRICPREISTERLQLQPRSVTCGPECAAENKRRLRTAGATRSMKRKRATVPLQ